MTDFNEYSAEAAEQSASHRPPTGLIVISVICLALGGIGMMFSCWSGLAFAINMQGNMFPVPADGSNPMAEAQANMMERINAINRRYMPMHVATLSTQMLLGVALLYGGIQCLRLRPSGHRVLRLATILGAVLVLLSGAVAIWIQIQTLPAYEEFMANMPQGGNPAADTMGSVMKGAMIAGLVIGAGWSVLQCGFYAYAHVYLGKQKIVDLFVRE